MTEEKKQKHNQKKHKPLFSRGVATPVSLTVSALMVANSSLPVTAQQLRFLEPAAKPVAKPVAKPNVGRNIRRNCSPGVPASYLRGQQAEAYTLGSGDRIQIDIFNVPEYSGTNGQYQVLVDGTVNLPLVGKVSIGGRTLDRAAAVLRQAYRPFLQRPDLLSVKLLQTRPLQIGIAGEVRRPGSYTIALGANAEAELPTVTRAIQIAGGITQAADIRCIQLRRPQLGGLITIDLWSLVRQGNLAQDITLRDGDTIFVPTATTFNPLESPELATTSFSGDPTQPVNIVVVGEVTRPGSYTVSRVAEEGGRLLTITRALQTAGGVTLSADIRQVQVVRRPKNGQPQVIQVNLWELLANGDLNQDVILQQGDRIVVPTTANPDPAAAELIASANFAADVSVPLNIVVVGEVTSPGSYTVNRAAQEGGPLLTITRALQTAGGITLSADIKQVQVIRRPKAGLPQVIQVNLWELLANGDLNQDVILQQGDTIVVPTTTNPDPAVADLIAAANFAADASTALNIAVVGEVNRPGTYTVAGTEETSGRLTLTRAIKTAGGITPLADIRQVLVRRQTRVGVEEIPVDLWQLLQNGDLNQDIILQQGDTISIPKATNIDLAEAPQLATTSFSPGEIRVNIIGEVLQPGLAELPPNSSLNQALLRAGGFNNDRAEKTEVELIRLNPNGTVSRQVVPVDFAQGLDEETNPTLRNNDVIVVNRSGLAKTRDSFGRVAGTIGALTSPIFSVIGFLRFFSILGP